MYQETGTGHSEEIFHETGSFIHYIREGEGIFVIEDVLRPVPATDVVIIPPKTRFWFKGALKQVLIAAPARQEGDEHHVWTVDLPRRP